MAVTTRLRSISPARRALLLAAAVAVALVWPFAHRAVEVEVTPEVPLEERAAASIRAIQHGQRIYQSVHGYYDRLECVIQDSCATLNPYPPTYLDPSLAWATRFGYRFRFHEGPRATAGRDEVLSPTGLTEYAMTAVPLDAAPGRPAFCGDYTGALYRRADGRMPRVAGGRCLADDAALH